MRRQTLPRTHPPLLEQCVFHRTTNPHEEDDQTQEEEDSHSLCGGGVEGFVVAVSSSVFVFIYVLLLCMEDVLVDLWGNGVASKMG